MASGNEIQKELEEISPLLSGMPRTTPLSAPPPGYFDNQPAAALRQARQAPVVSLIPFRKPWRLAAAASVAVLLLAGGWFLMQRSHPGDSQNLAASMDQQMKQVSESEMASFVDSSGTADNDDLSPADQISDDDIHLVLANVSDQDLQQYADQDNLSPNLN